MFKLFVPEPDKFGLFVAPVQSILLHCASISTFTLCELPLKEFTSKYTLSIEVGKQEPELLRY